MLFLLIFFFQLFLLFLLSHKLSKTIYEVFYRLTKNRKITVYLYAILFLPGTIIHEMSHFLFALFLLVPTGKVKLMPEIENSGVKLGSVAISKTDPFRRFLIGVAPLVLGTLIILISLQLAINNNLLSDWRIVPLISYLVFEIGNTMFLSRSDLVDAWKLLLFFAVFGTSFYLLGGRVTFVGLAPKFARLNLIMKKAVIFSLIPIVIDSVALLALNLTGKLGRKL